jgi:hypothetical protein
MGFFSAIKEKVATKLQGELVTDLGTLPIDEHGKEISVSIRRHSGKKPHLQVKLTETGASDYFQIPCSREWADQFEKIAREMRRQIDAPVA